MTDNGKTPPQGGEYIEHEEVPAGDAELTLEQTISHEVARFNRAEAGIAALQLSYGELVVGGLDDKAGYQAAKDAWAKVRGYRTGLEKKGLEIRGDYNKIVKAVSAEENRLLKLIEPLEERLEKEVKRYDELVAADKLRIKREAEQQLQDRIELLTNDGMVFEDGYYQLGGTISIDVATLRPMKEEAFQKLLGSVRTKAAELKAIREREEEDNRRKREELAEEQRKLKADREKFEADRDKLRKEQDDAARLKLQTRQLRFQALGMKVNSKGDGLVYDNGFASYNIAAEKITQASDDELTAMLLRAEVTIAENDRNKAAHDAAKEEERRAIEDKKKLIASLLTSAGLIHDYNANVFRFYNPHLALSYHIDKLLPKSEDELRKLATESHERIDRAKQEQERHEREGRERQERERQERLSDADRMRAYLQRLQAVELPKMQSAEFIQNLEQFHAKFQKLYATYLPLQEAVKV